jgi:hypothetical protein
MKRKNAILIPLSLTLSHLGEGISGIPTASGRVLRNLIKKDQRELPEIRRTNAFVLIMGILLSLS